MKISSGSYEDLVLKCGSQRALRRQASTPPWSHRNNLWRGEALTVGATKWRVNDYATYIQ